MPTWTPLDPFGVCLFAVACIVFGFFGLLWLRQASRNRIGERVVLSGMAVLALVTWLLDGPTFLRDGALAVAIVSLGLLLFRLPFLRHPGFLWAGLLLVGTATLVTQFFYLEQQTNSEFSVDVENWGMTAESALTTVETQWAVTDAGRTIPLFAVPGDVTIRTLAKESSYFSSRQLDLSMIRTDAATPNYNCHGYVFSGGRFWVRGAFVEQILRENGYIATTIPRVGGVIVYRENGTGQVCHTGIVRMVLENGSVLIESKLGSCGRFLHPADQQPYPDTNWTYYHTNRGDHLLRGLTGPRHSGALSLRTPMP